jgi:hypothetical protein
VAVFAALCCACVSVEVRRLTSDTFPPRPADAEVEVLLAPGARSYSDVAELHLSEAGNESWYRLLRRAKLEARRLGADAIILTTGGTVDDESSSAVGPPGDGKPRDRIIAIAIVYREPRRETAEPVAGAAAVAKPSTPEQPSAPDPAAPAIMANYRCDGADPIRGELVRVLRETASGDTVLVRTRGGTDVRVASRCVAVDP